MRKEFKFDVSDQDFHTPSMGWCGNRPKCVSVARTSKGVAVRDTKNPEKKTLFFSKAEWKAFLGATKSGEFDV